MCEKAHIMADAAQKPHNLLDSGIHWILNPNSFVELDNQTLKLDLCDKNNLQIN